MKPVMTCLVRSLVCQMLTSALVAMPPTLGQRSSRITFAPCRAAQHAAEMPAVPPPQTTTSASASTGTLRSGMTIAGTDSLPGQVTGAGSRGYGARLPPAAVSRKLRRVDFIGGLSKNSLRRGERPTLQSVGRIGNPAHGDAGAATSTPPKGCGRGAARASCSPRRRR